MAGVVGIHKSPENDAIENNTICEWVYVGAKRVHFEFQA
jgi:hypothetical protein